MATKKLNLSREQLATFLKNHEQIKQFEALFRVADEISPQSDTTAIAIQAANAEAIANRVASEVNDIKQTVDELALRPIDPADPAADGASAAFITGVTSVSVPNNSYYVEATVAVLGVLPSDVVTLSFAPTTPQDENEPSLLAVSSMTGIAGIDVITVNIEFLEPTSGPVLVNYLVS